MPAPDNIARHVVCAGRPLSDGLRGQELFHERRGGGKTLVHWCMTTTACRRARQDLLKKPLRRTDADIVSRVRQLRVFRVAR